MLMKKPLLSLLLAIIATAMFAQVAPPVFNTASGTYFNKFNVELTGSNIYYTIDGTTPTAASTPYTGAIAIDEFGTSTTIKAIAISDNGHSDVVEATYELKVSAPVFTVKGGIYVKLTGNDALDFTTETEGSTILYNDRNNGKSPIDEGSRVYGKISILSTKTITAIAYVKNKKGKKIYSEVSSEHYVISPMTLFRFAEEIEDSCSYLFNCGESIAQPLLINEESGNFNTVDAPFLNDDYMETNKFYGMLFREVEGGYTIQDAYGRYIYLVAGNDKLNFAAEQPAEGAVWKAEIDEYTFSAIITNIENGKVIAYNSQEKVFGAYTESEFDASLQYPFLFKETAYPSITITPEAGTELTEFSKITVTCEDGISYKETNKLYAYYNIGMDSKKIEFDNIEEIDDNTIEFTLDEPETDINEYKVIFPAGVFTLSPNALEQKNQEVKAVYTVNNLSNLEVTYANPANNSSAKDMQYLYFEFNQDIEINAEGAVITDTNGNTYPLSVSAKDAWGSATASNALCLKTEAPLPAGEYTFVLKTAYASIKSNTSVKLSNDITYKITATEGLRVKSVTPDNKEEYVSVDRITLVFNKPAMHEEFYEIAVSGTDGNTYTFAKETSEAETTTLSFKADTPITTSGTYTFTIYGYNAYCEDASSEELENIAEAVFTFTIKDTTGIEGVKYDSEKAGTIYDITGRRISKITKAGIYIIDGRKVFIR